MAGSVVQINNGGTAQIASGSTGALWVVTLGANTASHDGNIELSGGSFDTTLALIIGHIGSGHMTQSGSSVATPNSLTIANNGGSGTYDMFDGSLTTGNFGVGHRGTGHFNQTSGTVNITSAILGNLAAGGSYPPGNGFYDISAGSLTVSSNMFLGWNGTGTFTHSGIGDVNVGGVVGIGSANGSGSYTITGGNLTAGSIERGPSLVGVFNMNGGRVATDAFGSAIVDFPLTNAAGTLAPGGLGDGSTHIYGDYAQLSPATLEINIDGTVGSGLFDDVDVDGGVSLDGALDLVLQTAAVMGETYVIIDNDGVDPVSGIFAGLPQGSIISEIHGANTYKFQIDYFADTGNDVALTVVPEPATLILMAAGLPALLRRKRRKKA